MAAVPVIPAILSYRLKKSWTVTRAAVMVSRVISSFSFAWIAWCKSVLPLPTRHHTTGELVDDHHLAVDHDVVAVAEVGDLAAQRPLDVFI